MRRKWLGLALLVGVGLISLSTARGWWIIGHGTITEAAALALPDDMPAFFRAAAKSLAHLAGDPDRWKNRETPALNIAEYPHHFLDANLDEYGDKGDLDKTQTEFAKLQATLRAVENSFPAGMLGQ